MRARLLIQLAALALLGVFAALPASASPAARTSDAKSKVRPAWLHTGSWAIDANGSKADLVIQGVDRKAG